MSQFDGHQGMHRLATILGWHCWYCTHLTYCSTCEPFTELGRTTTRDHVLPRKHGGRGVLDNLVVACHACNSAKGDRRDWPRVNQPAPPPLTYSIGDLFALAERISA